MKWILSLAAVSLLASCNTKPWMVGSANDKFPLHKPKPGSSLKQNAADTPAPDEHLLQDREPGNLFRHP
ncbi:MAG: hypothetical protein KDK97_19950 [Verrucomicrobiales bacterium]|nr:hypothetical protein [Verrucomicrobiales bacterium]MCP5560700.1 hypothetical protein [Verrucomicrobiaceae bacterium]